MKFSSVNISSALSKRRVWFALSDLRVAAISFAKLTMSEMEETVVSHPGTICPASPLYKAKYPHTNSPDVSTAFSLWG